MANGIFNINDTLNQANQALETSNQAPDLNQNNFSNLLEDPNFIRALGEVGRISGEGSVGDILGSAGSNLARRKAVQQAGAQQSERTQTLQEQLIRALLDGKLLSPTNQNNAFDSITATGDGDVNLKLKNTPMEQTPDAFAPEQTPLEGIKSFRGGQDLPNFFKTSLR